MKRTFLNLIRMKLFYKKRRLVIVLSAILVMFYMGVFTHLLEKDFYSEFSYPLNEDISLYVNEIRDGNKPSQLPINEYNYTLIHECKLKCSTGIDGELRVVYIVKSAIGHFNNRLAIRNSWGFENRFSDVSIRTVFVLGVNSNDRGLQQKVDLESKQYGDIIQGNFTDAYFNNTIKTMISFKWAVNHCKNSKFYFFVDDDFYVSTRNVLQFLRNPVHYPEYLETPIDFLESVPTHDTRKRDLLSKDGQLSINSHRRRPLQVMDFELPEKVKLFSGYVFVSSPHRHRTSTWYVPLYEYPYHLWPPYVTAGAYVVSKEVLIDLHYGSLFTKHFRFDDIYLGIVAYKLKIEPFHCDEFYFYKKDYSPHGYHYVIASHGYNDPNELLQVWTEQKSLGNA